MHYFIKEYNGSSLNEKITYGESLALLNQFITEYPEHKLDQPKHSRLKVLLNESVDFYEQLPPDAKTLIDKMKGEIFPE